MLSSLVSLVFVLLFSLSCSYCCFSSEFLWIKKFVHRYIVNNFLDYLIIDIVRQHHQPSLSSVVNSLRSGLFIIVYRRRQHHRTSSLFSFVVSVHWLPSRSVASSPCQRGRYYLELILVLAPLYSLAPP